MMPNAKQIQQHQAKRAKKKLRALAGKAGMDGPWYWALPEHEGDLRDLPEESANGAKDARPQDMHPSHPSALPSAQDKPCTICGELLDQTLIDAGYTDHGEETQRRPPFTGLAP